MSIVRLKVREARRRAFEQGLNAALDYRLRGAPSPVCPHGAYTSVGHAWQRGAAMADQFADAVEEVRP